MSKMTKKTTGNRKTSPVKTEFVPIPGLEQWKGLLRSGFSAPALKSAAEGKELEMLRPLATDWIIPVKAPVWPQWRPETCLIAPDGGSLFAAGSSDEGLGCFDAASGRKIWSLPGGTLGRGGGLALIHDVLYAADRWNNRILWLDAVTGKELGRIEQSAPGRPLDEPSDILALQPDGAVELWICERGNHRISRLDPRGGFLGWIGARGLTFEETVRRFTGLAKDNQNVLFEFPESLSLAKDFDGKQAVFVWDEGNGRLVVLNPDGFLKRRIYPAQDGNARFCGQVRVFTFPGGPLVLGIDDAANCLRIWDHEGFLLVSLSLDDTCSRFPRAERLRFALGTERILLVSSRGRTFVLNGPLSRPEDLIQALIALFPDSPELRLSLAERQAASGVPPCRDKAADYLTAAAMSQGLLTSDGATEGILERNTDRLVRLASRLRETGGQDAAAEILESMVARLNALISESASELIRLGRPDDSLLDRWSAALADLDMSLVSTKGRNQKEEMALDDELEEIRDYPDITRKTAWRLRAMCSLAAHPALSGILLPVELMSSEALSMRLERRELLNSLAGRIDLAGDPAHVKRDELVQVHRALQAASARERVAAYLSDCLAACGPLPDSIGKESDHSERVLDQDREAALASFQALVDNMGRYLKALNEAGGAGGPFGRVVTRQREIFSLKASLLVNTLCANGSTPVLANELAEKAARLAGNAWRNTSNLRFISTDAENG
jgi:hypothetical protein